MTMATMTFDYQQSLKQLNTLVFLNTGMCQNVNAYNMNAHTRTCVCVTARVCVCVNAD